jgi:hypothetical protein
MSKLESEPKDIEVFEMHWAADSFKVFPAPLSQ